jgi:protein-S-isoprenylcysteine O-methyltransferase Ste14
MMRMAFFIYGVTGHLLFLATYAWLAGFVGNLLVPRSIDSPTSGSVPLAVAIDVGLIALFGLQHSIMARPAFKQVWTRIVPQPIERATYVFASCAVTMLLIWQWRPIDLVVWDVQYPPARWLLHGLFAAGWLGVPAVSLMIHHFDLFGTRQVWLHLQGREYTPLPFRTPLLYAKVRHPLYLAWAIAFWATPTMTAGHLLLAAGMTAYMLVAVVFEERDLIAYFGHQYEEYRRRVPMFVPWLGTGSTSPSENSSGVPRPIGRRAIRPSLDIGVVGRDESDEVGTFDEEFLHRREPASRVPPAAR